jgi:serine protease AprX
MADRSVRWGRRSCKVLGAALVGIVAVPTMLSAAASAEAGSTTTATSSGTISVLKDKWGDKEADKVSKDAEGGYSAKLDPGSMYTVTRAIGAPSVWSQLDSAGRAVTGRGVTVALLDSGLTPVPGLDGAGKVVQGPDLSLENESDPLRGLDTFGHGTHLGAIIAAADASIARDAKTGVPKPTVSDQVGVAPDATLLPLKLATANGSTDVSQVIAALDWVSQHQNDNGMNVRVVNLSFGTDSLQPYELDPLAAAAENAWRRGLVVVVSGGNEGQLAGRLTDPGMDPYVIAVGASDPNLRVDGWKAPRVAEFSNSGSQQRHVDLLAPGRSITSLRDPGSFIDSQHPEGRVDGDTAGRLFRGSGTSQAAAVVSGAAALLLQAYPGLTPDQVKALLVGTAKSLTDVSPLYQGAGEVDVAAAVAAVRAAKPGSWQAALLAGAAQTFPVASGAGSLEAARGGSNLVDPDTGEVLAGELDVQGLPFDAASWASASAAGTAWTGGLWNSARWSGDGWESARWSDANWSSARWSSARWSGDGWDSARWSSARWSDVDWSSARWSSARWSDASWDSARWSSARWS